MIKFNGFFLKSSEIFVVRYFIMYVKIIWLVLTRAIKVLETSDPASREQK